MNDKATRYLEQTGFQFPCQVEDSKRTPFDIFDEIERSLRQKQCCEHAEQLVHDVWHALRLLNTMHTKQPELTPRMAREVRAWQSSVLNSLRENDYPKN